MGRKLNFTSLFSKSLDPTTAAAAAATKCSSSSNSTTSCAYWPSCKHPRTSSFHYKTGHPALYNSNDSFAHSLGSLSNDDDRGSDINDSETIIRGLMRSNRLFFEPGGNSRSILEEATKSSVSKSGVSSGSSANISFKESTVVVAMESEDPYNDFRKSMEEMVVAHGLMEDWDCLEELLVWYLRVNGKKNHGYIVGAFVDLLVGLGSSGESFDDDTGKVVDSCRDSVSSTSMSFENEEMEGGGSSSC